jgi:hypothetical protein
MLVIIMCNKRHQSFLIDIYNNTASTCSRLHAYTLVKRAALSIPALLQVCAEQALLKFSACCDTVHAALRSASSNCDEYH